MTRYPPNTDATRRSLGGSSRAKRQIYWVSVKSFEAKIGAPSVGSGQRSNCGIPLGMKGDVLIA
jgi:hypothetical protein